MSDSATAAASEVRPEIWPALLSIALVGLASLPLTWHLGYLPILASSALLCVLLILLAVLLAEGRRAKRRVLLMRRLGQFANGLASLELFIGVVSLAYQLTEREVDAKGLLFDAMLIWIMNILVFAVWYWVVDGGGPHARHAMRCYTSTDFVFPERQMGQVDTWQPSFLVYLFLAFNTSTAFSPTDTLVISDRARLLMMAQAAISLITLGLLAARAVNTLKPKGS